MDKGHTQISGNSRYTVWKCDVCDHEEMKCTGVMN